MFHSKITFVYTCDQVKGQMEVIVIFTCGANSGSTSIKNFLRKRGQGIFIFQGGQNPQKDISFDHFVQENGCFLLVSVKSGEHNFPPLPSPSAATGGKPKSEVLMTKLGQNQDLMKDSVLISFFSN